jgi:tetratricopeptide (TPR) repeat protein
VYAIVAAICVAAGGVAVGIALTEGDEGGAAPALRSGNPPLELDLGIRNDREAFALRRAQRMYANGKVEQASAAFGRYRSVDARVGAAMADWPASTVSRLEALTRAYPRSAVVRLNLGFALFWARDNARALAAWCAAERAQPDSPAAVRAGDLLHPAFNRGLPTFVPSFSPPSSLTRLSPARQLRVLARTARRNDVRAKLLYGVALQRLGRPVSAEREFGQAAALAPADPDAQVAAAVGRFDKDHPERAFSRLGPLTRSFPHASTVRFHLGLLLLWLGQVREGTRQLRLARAEGPSSPLGREAAQYLRRLRAISRKQQEK